MFSNGLITTKKKSKPKNLFFKKKEGCYTFYKLHKIAQRSLKGCS